MLYFMMGEFRADLPTDRLYATNHMWVLPGVKASFRFGFTSYAIRLLQDVYFLEWNCESPSVVSNRQNIGSIESKKAESDLFTPCAGTLVQFNDEAIQDPAVINVDPYGEGWLFEIESNESTFLTPEAYVTHLEEAWKVAERTIKGQIQ